MPKIEFWYDFVSPYTYLAAARLRREQPFASADIDWCPLFLGGVMQLSGNRPPAEIPNKCAFLFKDLQRLARYYGIDFRWPSAFPILTLLSMRAALVVKRDHAELYPAYCDAMFRGYWAEDRNIADPETWRGIVSDVGLDAEALHRQTEDPAVKALLKDETARAVDRGVFGAPSFFVEEELYWGVDRMFLLEAEMQPKV
jgi:2-hydroxychromene-2-carboxylate isomerase